MLVSNIECSGTEQNLHLCPFTVRSNHICDKNSSAGVMCSRDYSKYCTYVSCFAKLVWSLKYIYTNTDIFRKCVDERGTLPQNQIRIKKMERYSHCN